ncbi:hypothetical protein GOODEAATRI_011804, partial [Goodea atripinnis]
FPEPEANRCFTTGMVFRADPTGHNACVFGMGEVANRSETSFRATLPSALLMCGRNQNFEVTFSALSFHPQTHFTKKYALHVILSCYLSAVGILSTTIRDNRLSFLLVSEHVDVERREVALFLLELDRCNDPEEKAESFFGEGFLLGALPNGRGGREDVGELENTSVPLGLHLRLLDVGMGILGDTVGTDTAGDDLGGHPLGISTQWEEPSESFEHKESEDGKNSLG